jgi:hypothetical protein
VLRSGAVIGRRHLKAIAVAASVVGLACDAVAGEPAETALRDVGVSLKSGALLRGELVEKMTGDHLILKLATGEVRRIEWTDIESVATAPADTSAAAEPAHSSVRLFVDANKRGVLLERRANATEGWQFGVSGPVYGYAEQWEAACVPPCQLSVDPNATFRVNGDGFSSSPNFTVPPGHDVVRLHLVGRSAFLHGTAITLTFAGGFLALLGGLGVLAAPVVTDPTAEKALRGIGVVGLAAGVLMMAVGIPTWIATYSVARGDDGRALGSAVRPGLAF